MERPIIEGALESLLDNAPVDALFRRALRHAVFPGGKRIRPWIYLAACRDLGAKEGPPSSDEFRVAAAIELLHCATLVHDDLPALDNDEMRRGQPSTHIAYGEAVAILVGDYLPMFALASLAGLSLRYRAEISHELARAYSVVCHGQYLDLDSTRRVTMLREIHRQKTGSFFEAALCCAALTHERGVDEQQSCAEFGRALGEYFQMADDYLDRYGDTLQRGRERRSDLENVRVTAFCGERSIDDRAMDECTRMMREKYAAFKCGRSIINSALDLPISEIELTIARCRT